MGVNVLFISVACTVLSLAGLHYWTYVLVEKHKLNIADELTNSEDASRALELLLGSYTTLALVASFSINVFVLIILSLKTIFFSELYTSEMRKTLECLINYFIYKGIFLPLVVPPTVFQAGLWSTWLALLCFLKMFQALARDRLERLNVSPSVTPWTYFRVYSALLLVLSIDLLWIFACLIIYNATSSPMFLLLFFEPSSIAFETLQAIVVHGFQLLEIWFHHSAGDSANCRLFKILDISPADMKASIKFRDEQKPLMRAKIPLNVLNLPFQAGVVAGESKELSLNLGTFWDSGPSLKFSYRPNDSKNPFGFIFKTGVGHFGSPTNSALTMSAEFNLIGNQNPSFFIHFKPNLGDFTLKKSHSSDFVKNLGDKFNGEDGFMNNGYFKGANFFPATVESKAVAGEVVSGLVKGVELGAKTSMPLRDFAVVNCRWGLRVPPQEAVVDEVVGGGQLGRKKFGVDDDDVEDELEKKKCHVINLERENRHVGII
ncbi:hypothetical protein CASFOL_017705 [Castilleja foliolosa]|uniref:E3 ubiquitin-protein ligase synoviolin-like TPR repeats domain-containing protein n=1 Tax=Castilleja foliolosa TaxID=1961234 RepID=A0ABD3DB00_9LAMI